MFLVVIGALFVLAQVRARRQRREHGFAVEDFEVGFLKAFVGLQGLLLFAIVMNGFRCIPLSVVILGVVAVLVSVVTQHTPFGRYLYAIGDNEEAAAFSGIPIQKVVIGAYALLGGVVALTGFMQTAYAGASTTTVGDLRELDAIAACVIGGTSLKGAGAR